MGPRRQIERTVRRRAISALACALLVGAGCARHAARPVMASFEPVWVPGVVECRGVAAGAAHACALHIEGSVICWGNNAAGQLGSGTTAGDSTPVLVEGLGDAVSVTAGRVHTCALRSEGTVACWGDNHEGQLGNRAMAASASPVPVPGLAHVLDVASGWAHSCALVDDGSVWCWGNNEEGQLGAGNRLVATGPVEVARIDDAVEIAAGVAHTCAVLYDGRVACWGTDGFGQPFGTSFGLRSTKPVLVAGVYGAVAVAAGRNHSCVLLDGGTVRCWGANVFGQLGAARGAASPSVPVDVEGVTDAVAISAGFFHTCAIARDGSVRCWGANIAGQLGAPSPNRVGSVVPVGVAGDPRVSAVAAGGVYTCAVLVNGDVACWGGNDFNQLGAPLAAAEAGT
jgi:alpha-tubulin suppressor-like RCC1 family protein